MNCSLADERVKESSMNKQKNKQKKNIFGWLDSIKKEKESETWSHVITVKLRVTNSNFKL